MMFSNSTDGIDFKHNSTFKGTVHDPYADVVVKNSADVYGMIWANGLDIKNTGELYFDTALKDKWLSDTVEIVSWREVIN